MYSGLNRVGASSLISAADPKAGYLAHKEEIDSAVCRVLDGGTYILGEEAAAFEREFADYLEVAYSVGVGNGTDALHLALRVCGIGAGDLVITASHTAVATVAAIELAGASPILVDIDPETFTLDVKNLEATITRHRDRVKAIIPVHLYGHPADMPSVMEIAARHELFVIEDCAQSHGAALHGRKTGGWGHLAAFSFYPTKNLGALGDGGALVTNDSDLAERARLLRQYGWRRRYVSEFAGLNTRLDEIQASILRVKLRYLDMENARRRQIASAYNTAFSSISLRLSQAAPPITHVYHQYAVLSERRDHLQAALSNANIGSAILYPKPVHLQRAYEGRLIHGVGNLVNSERVCREVLCLPIHPYLNDDEVAFISETVIAAMK
jgi:dTDP-4-amino-4,6-dideoxygalactose transaminase